MTKEALNLALEALENSVDLVREDAYNAEELYGNYPARQGKVRGLKVLADDHEKAITAIKAALEAKNEKPCPEFWDWLPKAYRHGDVGDEPRFTKYNMEVAFLAGKQSAALKAKDEPVATKNNDGVTLHLGWDDLPVGTKLYTTPPQRTWIGLTDEEISDCMEMSIQKTCRAIEAKLRSKNESKN